MPPLSPRQAVAPHNAAPARLLVYMLFLIFAMTTDAVGVIIPEVINEFDLTLTQAGSFHYATMLAIALSGLGLGYLADRYGRKIILATGMLLFSLACFGFLATKIYPVFLALIFTMGLAIGIFKTAALALVGDISTNTNEHTRTMNMAEGFFGIGAIVGPAVVTAMITRDVHWTWLYALAGALCAIMMIAAWRVDLPSYERATSENANPFKALLLLKNGHALGFSIAIALYVVAEAAIYVWMPTYLLAYKGDYAFVATYALTAFFVFRALGRFVGAWVLHLMSWKWVLTLFSAGVALCYAGAVLLGVDWAIWLLPLSGVFMSVLYPTINAKGISCFPASEHGAVAGVLLFFTAAAAAGGPLIMALIGDATGNVASAFTFSLACAVSLFVMAAANQIFRLVD